MKKQNFFLILCSLLTMKANAELNFVDTLFPKQWAISNTGQTIYLQDSDLSRKQLVGIPGIDINYQETSSIATSKGEIIVAVLDSGVDIAHPDLAGKIWYNSKLCKDAPNAKVLPCNGFNFLDGNNSLLDDIGHGTHVAGVIAANKNNIGIVGSGDSRIKIMPIKVLNNSVSGFVYNGKLITDVIADAMIFAIKNGAEVINLSLGWPKLIDTPKVRAAFQMAEDQNVIVVAAAGNNNKDLPTFPCSYESVICVGAHDNLGNLTEFTNHGAKVDVVAPGEYVVSTYPTTLESRVLRIKNYEVKRGSSQAAPFVTASLATLKLLRPGLKNDDVRSIFFNAVKSVKNNDKRFVKFGMLDQKALYHFDDRNRLTAMPLLKDLTEIRFNKSDLRYSFNLPVKNLSSTDLGVDLCVKSNSTAVSIDNQCFHLVAIPSGKSLSVNVTGSILDLTADSQINFEVTIDDKNYHLPLFFTRDLANDSALTSNLVSGGNFDEMALISSGRRISKMLRVMDKQNKVGNPEYFYLEKLKQTDKNTVLSLLTKDQGNYSVKTLTLPKLKQVLSIHRQDINLDGSLDYMVYGISNDKNLKLYFFDKNLNPLFGNLSEWTWPLSLFEGLPIDGGNEKFDWVNFKSNELGSILVPSINREYDMPEEDNSKNILDRVLNKATHQFYLQPVVANNAVTVKLRVLDSVVAMKKVREQIGVDSSYRIELTKTLPSNSIFKNQKTVSVLANVANDEESLNVVIDFDGTSTLVKKIGTEFPIIGSAIYSYFDLNQNVYLKDLVFTTLLNRSRANYIEYVGQNVTYGVDLINTWENPVLSLISAGINNGTKLYLMENRYSISFTDSKGSFKYDLPVYRDSSFPGQNFSETLLPIVSDQRPGVYINSTLIFGERLYSMIGSEKGLIRPMSLSLRIPDGCIPLNPELISGDKNSQYVFLCTDLSHQVSIKYLPMSEN